MKKGLLVVIDGQNGAGKTTVARLLHSRMPYTAFIHWDTIKKFVSGFKPNKKYHKLAKKIAIAMVEVYLENGVNVIYESFFGRGEFIDEVLAVVKKRKDKPRVFVYQIEAPLEIQMKRVKERWLAGKTKRLLTRSHVIRKNTVYEKYKYKNATVFDSRKLTPRQITNRILKDFD